MKKILMGTSALALAGTIAGAGKAEAATWDLDWGGFYEAAVAYRDSDAFSDDQDGVDVLTDQEIIFTPSIVLDNGLKFGVNIQLEGDSNTDADLIDEAFAFVEGSFGIVRIGSTDAAQAAMLGNAPDVSWVGASSGSLAGFLGIDEFAGTYGQPGGGDAAKIIYFTPRFSGFQLGVSYAHDGSEDKQAPNGTGGRDSNNLFSVGANYVNSFGAFDIALRAGYSTANVNGAAATAGTNGLAFVPGVPGTTAGSVVSFAPGAQPAGSTLITAATAGTAAGADSDPSTYAVNLNVGYAGFTVGGSYANHDDDLGGGHDFYDLGVSYKTGPWGMSLQYSHGDADGSNDSTDQYLGAVSYKLGPGVTAGAFAGYAEADRGTTSEDGFVIGTGFRLDF